ncbi:hypothetical protein GLYMA_16G211400v4 [Glycine max]|nr:hypothetical protein GLYMA_16G211400v4 [Glycine max]KAG4380634.1 hypothetical protein GLYMA_16G211400v4 [Glycine max]KAH1152272.1 hypothetical protein GYH30_045660 [Glycine max]
MAILVFSKNYASSSFCLDELVKIMECVKAKGRLIFPIFYDVDPCHVRHQSGSYGEALAMHEERFTSSKENLKENMERLQKWKMALNQAADVSGKHYKLGNEYEHEFIGKIVKEISNKINRTPLHVADYPVGLESRVQTVKSLLEFESDTGVHIVGIYGIGGMGKTTLARAVYNSIADQFKGLCFLDDVRENATKHGLIHLQEMLLSEIVGEKDIKIGSVSKGISIIKHRLQRKKILLILDDVDKLEQLRATVGGPNWFGSGSRVIVTTRDKHLLASHGVDRKYEVEDLNEEESLELLCWNAFKDDKVDPCYKDISSQAVAYASGLPLALEVVGSLLFGKGIKEWESALEQYKKIPNKRIQDILKVSYNALEEDQQKIFLDIACCLKGYELAEVEDILCAHYGVCMKYGIGVLVDKSLIKIKNGRVTLHELIEVMGKEIDRQESPKELGKHRRLWFHKDIIQVLAENTGTSEIEIISLDFPLFEEDEEAYVEWDGEAFKKMENLKTLIIRNSHFSKGPTHLPNSLRVLEWWTYPLQDLPTDFHSNKLAICKLPRSCFTSLELSGISKKFMNLTVLNFDGTECLTQIPDISSLQNLVKLTFECCENLVAIHDSVGFLDKLKILSAFGCGKLMSFPPIKLISLEQLDLSSCSSLESFPEILGKMENITQLELKYTPLKEFPFSFRNLARLRDLVLVDCGNVQLPISIVMLPELAQIFALGCKGLLLPKQDKDEEEVSSMSSNVNCLCLSGCNLSDEYFPMVLAWFSNVKELELSCNNFTFLPECIKECHSLILLNLDNCEHLQEIRGIPPNLEYFSAGNCKSLSFCCTAMLLNQELHETGNTMFCLPGTRSPEWFEQQSIGPSLSFWFRNKFPVMDLCFVIGPMGKDSILFRPIMTINGNTMETQLTEKRCCLDFRALDYHILIIGTKYMKFGECLDKPLTKNEWNHVVVSIGIEPTPKDVIVKQTGLHVIKPESSMDDVQFTNPYKQPSFKEKQRLVDIVDCHRQFMQQQTTLVSLKPHVRQGGESFSLLPPQACKNNMNWDSNSTGITSTSSVQGYEIALQNLRLDMGVLQFVQQRKRLAILGLSQQRRMASLDLQQRRGREMVSLLSSPSLELMVSWQRRCITSVQGLQEQHLPSTIKQNFEGCNGIYEAKVSEMVECNSNDGNDNDRTSSPVEQLPMAKDSKSPVAANISQSSVTYPTCSKMTSVKEEQPQLKLLSKKELPELSKFCISDDGGTKCNTLCSIGEESSVMQQNSVKETNLPNDNGIFPNIESNLNKQQHNDVNALYGDGENTEESLQMFDAKAGEQNEENNMSLQSRIQEAQSDSNAGKQVEHPDQKGDFSDDLVNAIKRIESRILAFQLCSNLSGSTKNSAGLHTTHEAANSDCPVIKRNNGASGSQMNSGKSLLDGRRLVNQKTCNESSKGENSISSNALVEPFCAVNGSLSQSQMANQNRWHHNGAESAKSIDIPQQIGTKQASVGEWLRSRNRIQNSVQNIAMIDRVKSLKRLVSGDAYFGSQASECIQGLRVPLNQDEHTKKHSMLVSKTNRESMVRLNPVAWSKTDQNRKEKGSESSYAQKLAGSKALISGREKPPLHQMVMKPTLLDQRSSEIKVSSHEHRDSRVLDRRITHKTGHLEPRKTRVLPQDHKLEEANSNSDSFRLSSWQGSANSSSDSEDYSLPDGTQYPSSAMMVDSAYEGSSEESNNSYLKKEGGTSRRFGSFKPYRHHRERNPKETVGRLRRLKNKLGLIFHHHHHHHHYHHHDDDVHGHRHTMWNQLQNVFHHKVKHGVTTNKVDKTRRGAVARVLPQRNHVGQFHRLAEGVLRHIRHSKKPNPFKLDGMKQLRNGHSQKKLRWWQNLRPHRRVRLKKKGRVKMGFMSQKSLKNY